MEIWHQVASLTSHGPALQTLIMTVICQNAMDVKMVGEGFPVGGERLHGIGEHLVAKDAFLQCALPCLDVQPALVVNTWPRMPPRFLTSSRTEGVHMLPHISPSEISLRNLKNFTEKSKTRANCYRKVRE